MSPFQGEGRSKTTISVLTIIWLVWTQIFASVGDASSPARVITDRLYRMPRTNPETLAISRQEAERLVVLAIADENRVTPEHRTWLVEDVAVRASLVLNLAEARFEIAFTDIVVASEEARDEVDTARAASAALSIPMGLP